MAKDLKSGLDKVFGKSAEQPQVAAKPVSAEKPTSQAGLPDGYDRETFIVSVPLMDKIRDLAYWDRQLLKETVEAAFTDYIESWEKKNGKLKSRPEEVKAREQLRSKSGRPKGSKNK